MFLYVQLLIVATLIVDKTAGVGGFAVAVRDLAMRQHCFLASIHDLLLNVGLSFLFSQSKKDRRQNYSLPDLHVFFKF